MAILSAGASDIGLKRKTNQDSICILNDLHFFAVADGMGGHQGGDIASQLSVKLMPELVSQNKETPPKQMLLNCFLKINQAIINHAEQNPQLKGMGTTISSLYLSGAEAYVTNVGDSRVYLIHKGGLYQLSRDHSFVQEKMMMGIITREEAALDKQKNILIRSVGFEDILNVDIFTYKISKNDLFLICSDGLHGKVTDHDILYIVQNNLPDLSQVTQQDIQSTVDKLIQQANKNGGQDNISVIMILAQA